MANDWWQAPLATGALDATVEVPGSKSLTNRFLVLAALAEAPVEIRGGLRSRDSALMIAALRSMGVGIDDSGDVWRVTPGPLQGGTAEAPLHVDCGLAGTVMRFVPPMVLVASGPVHFDGDEGARVRPMGPLLEALRALGASVDDGGTGTLPFTVTPPSAVASEVAFDSSASSQFVTGLLLTAPRLPHAITVRHTGESLPSLPHIDMTCETLRDAGITVDQPDERTWTVTPGPLALGDIRVEPDLSNAGPFMAAALVAGGTVRIPGWPAQTTQPGAYYPELLNRIGGTCTLEGDTMVVTGDGTVHGIEADLGPAGEITPTIAALCALADTPSHLFNIGHLRGHETDRLEALRTEIERIGGRCTTTDEALFILPAVDGALHGEHMQSYHDHRMATFAAIIGLRVPDTEVFDIATTAKTMPDFPEMWLAMVGSAPGSGDE